MTLPEAAQDVHSAAVRLPAWERHPLFVTFSTFPQTHNQPLFQYFRGSCSRRKQDAQHVTLPRVRLLSQQSFPQPVCIDKEVTVQPPCKTPQRLPREVYPWHRVDSCAPAVFQLFSRSRNRG